MAFNIVAGISLLISIIFIGALMPTIISATNLAANATHNPDGTAASPVTETVVFLIPLAVVVATIIGIFATAQPQRQVDVGY